MHKERICVGTTRVTVYYASIPHAASRTAEPRTHTAVEFRASMRQVMLTA